MKDLRINEGHS